MNSLQPPGGTGGQVQRRHGGNVQRHPRISESFYDNTFEHGNMPEGGATASHFPDLAFPATVHRSYDIKKYETRQSRRLPHWAWYILVRFLGIRLHPTDKPIFGTIMHVFTLAFSFTYIVTFSWYTAYDIMNEYTRQTVLTGMISIVMVIYWGCLGVYANKLAARLFSSQKFVDSVRLHTRTVFKVSAAGLMILIATASTILNNYTAASMYSADNCRNLTVSVEVCYVLFSARVGYSVFSLIWNLLVGIVLLSVCRTHTIGIRRFIKQLENDGRVYELFVRNVCGNLGMSPLSDTTQLPDDEHYEWDDDFSPITEEYYAIPSPSKTLTPTDTPTRTRFPGGFGTMETNQPRGTTGEEALGTTAVATDDHNSPEVGKTVTMETQAEILVDVDESRPVGPEILPAVSSNQPTMVTEPASPACPRQPIIIVKEGSIATNDETDVELQNVAANQSINLTVNPTVMTEGDDVTMETDRPDTRGSLIHADPPSFASRSTQHSMMVEINSPRRQVLSTPSIVSNDSSSVDQMSEGPNMLSPDSILLCYWRIGCRLRSTSIALQRWLVASVCFILAWSVSFIVSWIHHEATLTEIAAFLLPILLLPLVCSAYGEVNMEGKRMVMSVCPTNERVQMLMFLENQPLQLMVFGFPISYSTIVKTVGALGLAFGTKIVLEELSIFK